MDLEDEYTDVEAAYDIDLETFALIQDKLHYIMNSATGGATLKKGIIMTRAIRIILAAGKDLEGQVADKEAYEYATALPLIQSIADDEEVIIYSVVVQAFGQLIGDVNYSTNAANFIEGGALIVIEKLDNALDYERRKCKGKGKAMDTIIKSLVADETAAGIRVPGLAAVPSFLPSAPPMVAGRGNRDPLGHKRNLWTDGERLQLLQLYRSDSGFHTHQERATELKRLTQSSYKRTPVSVRLEYKRLTANMALPQAIQQLQPSTVGQAAITATIATSANRDGASGAGADADRSDENDTGGAGPTPEPPSREGTTGKGHGWSCY